MKSARLPAALLLLFAMSLAACTPAFNSPQGTLTPEAFVASSGVMAEDDESFPTTQVEFTVTQTTQDTAQGKLTLTPETGEPINLIYANIAPQFGMTAGEMAFIKYDDLYLITIKRNMGDGNSDRMIVACYDGHAAEFIHLEFAGIEPYFNDGGAPLFSLEWTGNKSFDLTCNINGNTRTYEVNEEHYSSVSSGEFAEFNKRNNPLDIKEFLIESPDEQGAIHMTARLTYGDSSIVFANAHILATFNTLTRVIDLTLTDYEILENAVTEG